MLTQTVIVSKESDSVHLIRPNISIKRWCNLTRCFSTMLPYKALFRISSVCFFIKQNKTNGYFYLNSCGFTTRQKNYGWRRHEGPSLQATNMMVELSQWDADKEGGAKTQFLSLQEQIPWYWQTQQGWIFA